MKKLISLLLAVSVMAMSSTTFAASLSAGGQRNPGSYNDSTGNRNSNYLRDGYGDKKILAVYRAGDTLTFSNSDQTKMAKGDVITFISSKVEATDLNSSTVMFIDQVTADSDSPSYSYKIREGLADGIYKMDIKIGDAEVDSFYYMVGNPKVEVLYTDEDETVQTFYDGMGVTYYFATATMGSGDVMYEQAGVKEFGFDFGNNHVYTFDAATFDEATDAQEIEGTVNWIFAIGVTGIEEDGSNAPEATGALINE